MVDIRKWFLATLALLAAVALLAPVLVLLFPRRYGLSIPIPSGVLGKIVAVLVAPVMATPLATLVVAAATLAFVRWR